MIAKTIEEYIKNRKVPTQPFCMICKGIFCYGMKCVICRRTDKQTREDYPELVAKYRELHILWSKMKKYKQISCGISELDKECKEAFGDWLK